MSNLSKRLIGWIMLMIVFGFASYLNPELIVTMMLLLIICILIVFVFYIVLGLIMGKYDARPWEQTK